MALFRRTSPGELPRTAVSPRARFTHDDRERFASLYDAYFALIYRYCLTRLGSRERAEDAAHQVFVRALEAFDRYQETGRAREWLFAIAHNVVANEAARRTAGPLHEGDDILDPDDSPESLALAAADQQQLREAVARLPAVQRQAIELRIAGLTGREIAAELGRSPDAVKMIHLRAIDRLRAELGGASRRGGRDGS